MTMVTTLARRAGHAAAAAGIGAAMLAGCGADEPSLAEQAATSASMVSPALPEMSTETIAPAPIEPVPGSAIPPGTTAAALLGRTFVSTSVMGQAIPGGGPLTVTFVDGARISASAGCNAAIGSYEVTADTLTAAQLATTMMACVGPAEGADAWLLELFAGEPQWELSGAELTLRTAATSVTLTG